VCWDKSRGRWSAHVAKDGVTRYPGRFRDELAAAEAYDEAARAPFGAHARLNVPDGVDAAPAADAAPTATTTGDTAPTRAAA
jgi:hypothetical protein